MPGLPERDQYSIPLEHIMVDYLIDPNSTECMCSDLQTVDYSPLYAGFNLALIIIALPLLSLFDSARSYIPELARAPYTTVYILPFGYMAQTCSIYFTVAAAFDCFVNVRKKFTIRYRTPVCWKSVSNDHCTTRRAKQICTTVIVASIIYNSLRFPQFNLRKCFHDTSGEQIIEICPTTLFFTINMVYNVYMYMVLMTLLPFLFLLCLNAVIVLRQSLEANKQKEVSKDSSDSLLKPAAKTSSGDDTITMIMALVVNLIETFFDPDPLLLNLLSDASNFLVILNSSVNSVIYFVFNKEYREIAMTKLHRMIDRMSRKRCCCCCRLCAKRRDHQDPTYHPVANGRDNGRPPSLRCVVSENNADTVTSNDNNTSITGLAAIDATKSAEYGVAVG
ncbi:hypothetical protein TELCIR_04006 [Teladorsagia circumcincta]|uniref:G-protein coupled receptors family 1 profile domain-containing protein n=1 Tax=Teladorsagia circumcincta TaxID=45464 RepID=A0A2G9UUS6_TELCI|nr:hypothetical protein TELCIR_04006 [Teladorsagia circumcincta]